MSYTYYDNRKLDLVASPNTFVSRAKRRDLMRHGFRIQERLSPNSYRVESRPGLLQVEIERASHLGPAFPDYSVPNLPKSRSGNSEYRITDRIFVRFKQAPSHAALNRFQERYKTQVLEDYRPDQFLMQILSGADPTSVVRTLVEGDDGVANAEHDVNRKLVPQQISLPNDDNYAAQWHLHDVAPNDHFVSAASIGCDAAWTELDTFGDPNVVICVTDGAFDIDHPDFDDKKIAGWAYFDENKHLIYRDNPKAIRERLAEGPPALVDHGTACAGLAAASANKVFAVGVAPACRLYLIKFRNDGVGSSIVSDSEFITMIRHIRTRVDIVSSSWGRIEPISEWSSAALYELDEAARDRGRRAGKGIVFVWAAGNSDRPLANEFTADVPVPYERDTRKTALLFKDNLVGRTNVLHVAASTSRAMRAHYSNYGSGIDLAAPSNNEHFFRCPLPADAEGIPIRSSGFNGVRAFVDSEFAGTSASAPIVAGVAALVISAAPDITAAETIEILKLTAERTNLNLTPYPRATCINTAVVQDVSPVEPFSDGSFKPSDDKPPRSDWFGFGRVSAVAAVTEAKNRFQAALDRPVMAVE